MATRNFRIDPSYFFVFYFSVHTSTEPTLFEHLAGYRSHQFGYFSASGTISWLPYLPVERGSFFPAEYLLRRRRVRSLRLEDLADLYVGVACVGVGTALDPLDGLSERLDLPEP